MDLTQLFKACVKTIRLRAKSSVLADKRTIKSRPRDEFLFRANDVRYQVTQLHDLLVENRSAYMRFGCHLKVSSQMSDEERNIIDEESKKIITICNQYLNNLQAEYLKNKDRDQLLQHKMAILNLLYEYLNDIMEIHNEQKGNRTQHELDTYKLLKLESKNRTDTSNYIGSGRPEAINSKNNDENTYKESVNTMQRNYQTSKYCEEQTNTRNPKMTQEEEHQISKFTLDEETTNSDDLQVFEMENIQLLNVLKGFYDEVEQIEKNVVGIARLQNVFTEKVTVQKYDIERIGNIVIGATENIKDANEQIKQAIQRNAGLRVWILFFLIVMSFTLLFLDWYNE